MLKLGSKEKKKKLQEFEEQSKNREKYKTLSINTFN